MTIDLIEKALKWGLLKSLEGKTFCMTGTMSKTRTEMITLISVLGGLTHSQVKSDTQYLIQEGSATYTAKAAAAARSGRVKIINEAEFCAMILPTLEELLS